MIDIASGQCYFMDGGKQMLAKERLNYIRGLILKSNAVDISSVAKQLNVSLSTIQRDLRTLEKEGILIRTRGGAISPDYDLNMNALIEESIDQKAAVNEKAKQVIACEACRKISNGQCIFIDSGSTTAAMASYLMNKQLTIVTNSHFLITRLRGCKAEIIMLGGIYNHKYDMSYGSQTIEELSSYHFDTAFISAIGVDARSKNVYSVDRENGMIKKTAIANSDHTFLLADETKFKTKSVYAFATTNDFDEIIVDKKIEAKLKNVKISGGKENED